MTEKLKQTIKEEVMKLPKEAQEAINAFDWAKIVEEIGKKYLLSENEINNLQVETLLILVGLEDGDFYTSNIEDNVGTTKEEAERIANEVFEKVITPISNFVEEAVKKNLKNKNPGPEQTIDFILSGGDYSVFLSPLLNKEGAEGGNVLITTSPQGHSSSNEEERNVVTPPSLADIKAKLIIDNPGSRAELTTGQAK